MTKDDQMTNDIDESKFALPESLFFALRSQLEYGRKALAGMIELNRYGAEKYAEILAIYDSALEENLDPEFVETRRDHRIMLTQIRDRYVRTLEELERLQDRLG